MTGVTLEVIQYMSLMGSFVAGRIGEEMFTEVLLHLWGCSFPQFWGPWWNGEALESPHVPPTGRGHSFESPKKSAGIKLELELWAQNSHLNIFLNSHKG